MGESVENGQRLLPDLPGGPSVAAVVVDLAEVGEAECHVVRVGELAIQVDGPVVAAGLPATGGR
ncbi:hypothetical protein GCM10010429_25650 [Micromonospora olivasterospora]